LRSRGFEAITEGPAAIPKHTPIPFGYFPTDRIVGTPPTKPGDGRNEFRLLIRGLEMWCLFRLHSDLSASIAAIQFRNLALRRN
jgi:hypothetical protein